MKKCSRCGKLKPLDQYYKNAARPDGVQVYCKPCSNSYEKGREATANKHLQKRYGIGIEQYNALLEKQGGCCAICKRGTSGRSGHYAFDVDHCHKTGKIRGILCNRCNTALGLFDDDPGRLQKAAAYLNQPPEENA